MSEKPTQEDIDTGLLVHADLKGVLDKGLPQFIEVYLWVVAQLKEQLPDLDEEDTAGLAAVTISLWGKRLARQASSTQNQSDASQATHNTP